MPASDREHALSVYGQAGFTGGFALGRRPVLLVVDLSRGFTDPSFPLGADSVEVHPALAPRRDEPVFVKTGASAFFGTSLHAVLTAARIDTVLVLGATTSGCVRASVVDAVQHGYDTFVVTDCCADRAPGPHQASLFDMAAKYADGMTAEEVGAYLEDLPERSAPSEAGR